MRPAPLLLAAALAVGCSEQKPAAAPTPAPTTTPTPTVTAPVVEPVDPLSPRPPVESPAPSPHGQPTCSGTALSVQDADLLADDTQLQEVFAVRTSGPTCVLRGWPAVSLLRPDGSPLTVAVRRTGTAEPLTLSRTTSLSFVLSTPRTSDCEDVGTVLVRLPGTTRTFRTPTAMQVCRGQVTVGPVERRQDDEGAEH